MKPILGFKGRHSWLSNFHLAEFKWRGYVWPSAEHAYQAAKTRDKREMKAILDASTPGRAKRLGRKATMRDGWDEGLKEKAMLSVLRAKFRVPSLRRKLLATGDANLVEVNHWGDTYWGVCDGNGLNRLGNLLMQVRDEMRDESWTVDEVRAGVKEADAFKMGPVFKWSKDHQFSAGSVYIGRIAAMRKALPCPSGRNWGNPFKVSDESERPQAIIKYREWLYGKLAENPGMVRDLAKLAGRPLVCHCVPKDCHGYVLGKAAVWAASAVR